MFNLIFSLAALYLLIFRWSTTTVSYRCLLVVCALIFTVWQPFLLWNKARKQAKRPAVKNPMRLIFDDEKLTVSQEENSADFTWEQMGRLDAKSSMYILYMDRVHAYLIPKETLGEQEENVAQLLLCQFAPGVGNVEVQRSVILQRRRLGRQLCFHTLECDLPCRQMNPCILGTCRCSPL